MIPCLSSHGSTKSGRAGPTAAGAAFSSCFQKNPLFSLRAATGGAFHQASVLQLLWALSFVLAPTLSPGHPGAAGW